ncbi:MAG: hypothetical protein Q9190_002953 [Brigantiaea leucoxantha]
MQLINAYWLCIFAVPLPFAWAPILGSSGLHTKTEATSYESSIASYPGKGSFFASRILLHFTSQRQPRSPVETPPTEYLPYAPPPNYNWPPGPHTENPPPSETNPPPWYGGTGTGGQGNSGAGSATHNSASSPLLLSTSFLPRILARLIPPAFRQRGHQNQARDPVETPPTQFLPYPPPPSYSWPPGENPSNENPQPSEPDPNTGSYGGSSGQGNTNSGGSASGTTGGSSSGGSGNSNLAKTVGIIIGSCVAAIVVLVVLWKWALSGNRKKAEPANDGGSRRFKMPDWKALFERLKPKKKASRPEASAATDDGEE